MIIKINNKFELEKAKEMVKLLNTEIKHELELGDFMLEDNILTKLVPEHEVKKPSEIVKEIKMMAKLIDKGTKADKEVLAKKDWNLGLSKKDNELVVKYKDIFEDTYSVWYADVIDGIFLRNNK